MRAAGAGRWAGTWNQQRARTAGTGGGGIAKRTAGTAADLHRRPRRAAHPQKPHPPPGRPSKGTLSFEPETGLFTAVALTRGGGAANHEAAVAGGLLGARGRAVNHPGRYRLRHRRAARAPPGTSGHAAVIITAAAAPGHPRRLHHRRLHRRRPGRHGHLPGRAHRRAGPPPGRRQPPGPVQNTVPRLPAARALHHRQGRARPHRPPPPRPAGRRPPHRHRASLARRIPAVAAPGRTGHRLAYRPRQPPRPLPRRHQEQHLAPPPGRRPQPAPTGQPRAHPHQRRQLGTRIAPRRPPPVSKPEQPTKIFSGLLDG